MSEIVIARDVAEQIFNDFYNEYHETDKSADVIDNFPYMLKSIERGRIEFENSVVIVTLKTVIPVINGGGNIEKIRMRELKSGEITKAFTKERDEISSVIEIVSLCNPDINKKYISEISQRDFMVLSEILMFFQNVDLVEKIIKKK